MVSCKRSAAVVKKLTNYEHIALSNTKSKPMLLRVISPMHFVVAMENTSNQRYQLIHM